MQQSFDRTSRVADELQRLLAILIQREVSDPRVPMVNINGAELTKDFAIAKVYVSFVEIEDADQCDLATAALNQASGFLRSLLAKELNLRTIPKLLFIYDKTPGYGTKLSSLIDEAVTQDRQRNEKLS